MKEILTGVQFCEMVLCAYEALDSQKQKVNELNVFPVPDGDTGTNMSLTMSAAAAEFKKNKYESVSEAASKAASALLRGARGNSGVILSLLFRGISKGLKGRECCTAHELAKAMGEGVDAAYKAVMKPAEGTILTVSRVGTKAAIDLSKKEDSIELTLACALAAAKEALAETPEQNPVLKRAGVVDAGGLGYCIILDAMLASLQGRMVSTGNISEASDIDDDDDHGAAFGEFSTEEIEFAYDTVYIVRKAQEEIDLDPYRAYLESIGDSLVISEDDEVFKVHVHTNIPGEALNEAAKYGVLELAKIENMRTQHDELVASKSPAKAEEPEVAEPEKQFGYVAVCAGEGLAQLFTELGVDRVVTGGQTMNPSTEDILREVNRTPAEVVFVFPNNKNIQMAAEQCARLKETKKRVIVIPTRTVPQGITAMLNLDTYADEETMVSTFNEVIKDVHTAQVTYAARDSDFDGHDIKAGEYLALLDGALVGSFPSIEATMEALNEAFKQFDPEFISVYYGEDVSDEDASGVHAIIEAAYPDSEVGLVNGGQPVYYYMISVE